MNNNVTKGKLGEHFAAKHLMDNGYKILDRRFSGHRGEIDIIAEKDDVIVFIEVKARSSMAYGFPSEAVTPSKQRGLLKTAELYIQRKQLYGRQMRMDVIEVYIKEKRVNHIVNAFGY